MTLATRTIDGNNSGPLSHIPKIAVMHSTRSGRTSFTDVQELAATLSWFVNPNGASSHFVVSKTERVRVVADNLLAWHSGSLNGRAWGIEFTQPTIDRSFGAGHYANAALVGRHYVKLGVAPTWLSYWDGNLSESGFIDHQDTVQGRASGKSDMGPKFDRARFIASLEEGMPLNTADKTWLKATVDAAVKPVTADVAALKKSHEGGELPGLWWKVKGVATIWYVDYVDGVLMRHSARNPQSYIGVGGDWKVIPVTAKQRDATALGAPLPDLKV